MDVLGMQSSPAQAAFERLASSSGPRLSREAFQDPQRGGREFEALMATLVVREMRRALPNGFFGKQEGADTFNGWFDEHVGRAIAHSGALGLAGMVKTALEREQRARLQLEASQSPGLNREVTQNSSGAVRQEVSP